MLQKTLLLSLSVMLSIASLNATKHAPTQNVKRCTNRAEEIAEREIPKWFMQYCTYKDSTDDDDGLQASRLRRRWKISESAEGDILHAKCKLALHDLQDDGKNRKAREAKMKMADRKKDQLINKYSQKSQLSDDDKAYLLSEGIVVEDDGSMTKTKDKLLKLNWHDVNPANIDAFEWGTKFIKDCRDNPDDYLSK